MRSNALFASILLLLVSLLLVGCKPDLAELVGRGKSSLERGRYEEALQYFNDALAEDPGNIEVMTSIGDVYLAQKKTDDAIKQYRETLEKAEGEALKRGIQSKLSEAELRKAEELWRSGTYQAGAESAKLVEDLALEITKTGEGKTREKAYSLLISLYDYQFEHYSGKYADAADDAKEALRATELAHIDKVFRTVRPPVEFRKRMRDRVKVLTEDKFFDAANKQYETVIRPALANDPMVQVSDERIAVSVSIPLTEEMMAADMTDPEVRALHMVDYYVYAKKETVKYTEVNVVAPMLGLPKLEKSVVPDKVLSFKIDTEEFFEDPTDKTKMVRITGSVSVEELRNLAFEYQLYLETEAKISPDGGAEPPTGADAAPAQEQPAPAEGEAPADAAPADGAQGSPADEEPAAPAEDEAQPE